MADRPPIAGVVTLPPDETVRAFEARDQLRITNRWSEMWHGDHARAFTVARIAKLDLLRTIRQSLDGVMRDGGTFEQWQATLQPELVKAGWWGRVTDRSLTGADHDVFVGSRRLRTIYDTNLRMSRAAGRWQRIQALKGSRPFLRYSAILDGRTRPAHRAWHGIILPVDHPWWDTHYPPCGWHCRCTVRQLSQRDLDRNGWTVTEVPPEGPPRRYWPAGAAKPVSVPAGIAPGFAYNPGKESMRAVADKAIRSLHDTALEDVDGARAVVERIIQSDALQHFLEEPGGMFPVGILLEPDALTIGAPSQVLVMPKGAAAKQRRNHSELTLQDYRLLPTVIHDPVVIVQVGAERLNYYRSVDGRWLLAVVRMDSGEPFAVAVSYHYVGDRDIRSKARRGTVVLDRRGL